MHFMIFLNCFLNVSFVFYVILCNQCIGSSANRHFYFNPDLIEFQNSDVTESDIYEIDTNHKIIKRAAELENGTNSTTASPVEIVTEQPVKNTTTNLTSSTPAPVEDRNTTEAAPTSTPHSNSLYDPDSGPVDTVKLNHINTSYSENFDHHRYYRSFSKFGEDDFIQYWVDLDNLPDGQVVAHGLLSSAYRRALTVSLKFEFPFYGHLINNVTIATGGFLFTGSFLHKWLAATQYIAPLMANFDTSDSPDSTVKYWDNGTSLTVQWEKVVLNDQPGSAPFTFQVTIHSTGHIIFAYKEIPVTVTFINDVEHPVKVGLSDAYIMEKTIFYVRKKTIYEYHKIDMKKGYQISNWTAIVFEPLTMCVMLYSCELCLTEKSSFECNWCPTTGRCSDGLDRHRQQWLDGRCQQKSFSLLPLCKLNPTQVINGGQLDAGGGQAVEAASLDSKAGQAEAGHSHVLVGLLLTFVFVGFIAGWVVYAYLHPHTASGQLLIKYRPSTWSFCRGEARYTAATMHSIHM